MKQAKAERVIFRKSYHPFYETVSYIAIFPDDPEFIDRVGILEFCFKYDTIYFEPYGIADINYLYTQKIVHKNDPVIPKLLAALKQHYGKEYEFRVCEKLINRENVVYR